MKYLKTFEKYDEGWIINIDSIVDKKIISNLNDISETVKEGDVVIGVWFEGDYEIFLLNVIKLDDEDGFGACDDDTCYHIDYAWGIFSVDEYKKLDPDFELKLNTMKYNL